MVREILERMTSSGRRMMVASIVAFTIYTLSSVAMAFVVLAAIHSVLNGPADLAPYWVALVCLLLVKGASGIVADKQKHCAGFDLVLEIRTAVVRRLKSLSLGFYTGERLGEIGDIVHKDIDSMEMVVGHLWTRMAADFIVAAILLAAAIIVDQRMALLMVSILPIALALLAAGLRKAQTLEGRCGDDAADMTSLFVEYVKGVPLLKAFAESEILDRRLEATVASFGESSKAASRNRALVLSAYSFVADLAFVVMAAGGALLVQNGSLPLFVFIGFIVASVEFYKPFFAMESHWMNYLKVKDSFRRIEKIIHAPSVPEPDEPRVPSSHSIGFDRARFSYGRDSFELSEATFTVPERTMTALVGESGSGKSTLANLLLRFWDVDAGSVSVGGVDVRDIPYDDLLASISVVMQDVRLFADTIEGNIRIGRADATHGEVVEAAKKACIHEFVMSLPQGYATPIGENGVGLSGGQKQRLSVARAFLKDAPILVLDEMTSNVDPVNEVLMQRAVSALAQNRTVLVVAHHLSTIRSADQIIVMQQGKIVQKGTHEQLLEEGAGYYRTLWEQGSKTEGRA
ncbi:ABC transporter ATP-binding protein [Slackia exigua]|uniref:ABC transporter, ATP-binding protein n=1 Tax=Slackia exigua (strain ATCC 700122 / DSM 15923 / CIP 105133 / JCM 11022 / KCTC 5966 / S-7) TaxID=649764 RepID=D0WF81_SLAES|nr:ABC transporter ATP-binding protein [Slackia exigua]EEZ61765.1 ABC transporter, ATP-binding protein [Slackia exigua ATCC 700122]STN98757.1 Putative multidrug export ATP-binding/permease protein SAV1866 [Slackia exigua]